MNARLTTIQVQKQILSPAIQQSIEILILPYLELRKSIDQELHDNPLLDAEEENNQEEHPSENLTEEEQKKLLEFIHSQDIPFNNGSNEDEPNEYFEPHNAEDSLENKLLKEIRLEYSCPLRLSIAEEIIFNMNEDGLLTVSLEDIAKNLKCDNFAILEEVLKKVQSLDPAGIAGRSLKECLLLQLNRKGVLPDELPWRIIDKNLEDLGHKRYQIIARNCHVKLTEVLEATKCIAQLDPRPARNHRPVKSNIYIRPDIFILKNGDKNYKIELNQDGFPRLRVNSTYKMYLKTGRLEKNERIFIRERLKNATNFIRFINQRGQTIQAIAQEILEAQKSFFDSQDGELVPLTLKDVAQKIDRNESTVSRAVCNKYMDTPRGLLPMKFFFSQAVKNGNRKNNGNGNGHDLISNRTIKDALEGIIRDEDKSKPLSDQQILALLNQKGFKVARRTISKYRNAAKILPAHLRKSHV